MYSTLSVALAEMQPWRGAGFFPFQLLWAQFGNWEEEGGRNARFRKDLCEKYKMARGLAVDDRISLYV